MTPEERVANLWAALVEIPIGPNMGRSLIMEAILTAVAEEREACARAIEEHACQHGTTCIGSWEIAAAIRART